jgi:PrcB C-terminal
MFALLFALLPAADAEPAPAVKVLASSRWGYAKVDTKAKGTDAKQLVIRDAAELVAALNSPKAADEKMANEALAKELKVKAIDWKKEMLVVVTGGSQRSGGYSVEVTGLKAKGDTLTVSWKLNKPKGAATAAFTHPGVVALVPRHKTVEFDPPAKKK